MLEDMVPVPKAVKKAKQFAQALFNVPVGEIRLEEIESGVDRGRPVWRITLSVPSGASASPASVADAGLQQFLFSAPGRWRDRDYKTFTLKKSDGEVLAVKIREFAAANG